ncbi:MAG: division/cell wall cluster transcriptional repressor MraZ [Betaproteobacteria bacterium]|nr:division/cell wall cluster transcriptional repressor MraZ [Betaproteobacteria bacterium]
MFQGASQLNLDAKGRLAVPTKHREPLALPGGGRLTLTAHPHGCLLLYPAPAWEPIRQKVLAFPSTDPTASVWKRILVGFAEEFALDNAGRILVSPELRDFAHIDKQVMFVGQGTHFEIWSVESWKAQLEKLVNGGSPSLPPGMESFSL